MLTATAILIISLLLAPEQGVVARLIAELRLRSRIVREHLLRSLYELIESRLPDVPSIAEDDVVHFRSWNWWLVHWQLRRAKREGLVELARDQIQLTPRGLEVAAELTRRHRIWEVFLIEHAGIAADHVDRDADDVEHFLPAPLVEKLESGLDDAGRLPKQTDSIPESPHEIDR